MELLTIIVHDPSQTLGPALLQKLQSEFARLHKDDIATELSSDHHGGFCYVYIVIAGKNAPNPRMWRDKISRRSAFVLADFIIEFEELNLIRKLVRSEYNYKDTEEMNMIEGYCRQFLFSADDSGLNMEEVKRFRREMIYTELEKYLLENNQIHLDGFITFRLSDYMGELREVIDYAVDEYQLDKQYQEFISLLQYFVYIQEVKVPSVHLLHEGGNDFNMLNSQLQPISTDDIDASFTVEVLNHNTNYEDVIVSTLITISPRQVFIHSTESKLPIIQTISQIFEGRVQLCHGCSLCKSHVCGTD